ncbi:MAG: hypothetical protein EXQ85_02240, partial [Alphaproteobacteria bacterium]|nr:hypothetical protein [Alphaproteobacteria bacterium]
EQIRGVTLSPGTLDILLEADWIKPRGRRKTPGRPLTYGTTDKFLEHFDLAAVADLPGIEDLRSAGLLRAEPPIEMLREAEEAAMKRKLAQEGRLPDEDALDDGDGAEPETESLFDEGQAPDAGGEGLSPDRKTLPAEDEGEDFPARSFERQEPTPHVIPVLAKGAGQDR